MNFLPRFKWYTRKSCRSPETGFRQKLIGSKWIKTMTTVGGDNFPDQNTPPHPFCPYPHPQVFHLTAATSHTK